MTAMKKILFVIAALASFMTGAQAQKISDVAVSDLKVLKDGDEMNITMDITTLTKCLSAGAQKPSCSIPKRTLPLC